MYLTPFNTFEHLTTLLYWWVNSPMLVEFCFTMTGRAEIEGLKKFNVAMNARLPQPSYLTHTPKHMIPIC